MKAQTPIKPLLYTGPQVCAMLGGRSPATLVRLEKKGKLKPVRMSRGKTATKLYKHDDVLALVEEMVAGNVDLGKKGEASS